MTVPEDVSETLLSAVCRRAPSVRSRILAGAEVTGQHHEFRSQDEGRREEFRMDYEHMGKEELLSHIRSLNDDLEDVVVMWGSKKDLRDTFARVAENAEREFTEEEARNAGIIVWSDGAFEEFIQMLRDSFERGGISYALSEKISALMEEVASRHGKD